MKSSGALAAVFAGDAPACLERWKGVLEERTPSHNSAPRRDIRESPADAQQVHRPAAFLGWETFRVIATCFFPCRYGDANVGG